MPCLQWYRGPGEEEWGWMQGSEGTIPCDWDEPLISFFSTGPLARAGPDYFGPLSRALLRGADAHAANRFGG